MLRIFAVLILAATAARADTVLGTGSFVPVPILDTGHGFWNNPSRDGTAMNIGYFLTGTGGFPAGCGSSPLCGANYLGISGQYYSAGLLFNDQPLNFSFLRNSVALQITILGAYSPGNMPTSFGYYDASATTLAAAVAIEVTLFASGTIPGAVGTSIKVSPYANYGFFETVCTAAVLSGSTYTCTATQTYFSNSNLNPAGETAHQHFALFNLVNHPEVYFIGVEESPANDPIEGLGDYNDVIIAIGDFRPSAPPAPEPATFSMIGVGLLVLGPRQTAAAAIKHDQSITT
jgi:hypothetical protein